MRRRSPLGKAARLGNEQAHRHGAEALAAAFEQGLDCVVADQVPAAQRLRNEIDAVALAERVAAFDRPRQRVEGEIVAGEADLREALLLGEILDGAILHVRRT